MRDRTLTPRQKTIHTVLNWLIVVAAGVLAFALLKMYFAGPPAEPILTRSAKISIPGVEWKSTERTLLIALTRDCEFCTKSGRFYRRIVEDVKGRADVKVVVIFPEDVASGAEYLNQLDVSPAVASQASLPSLGIKSVPTLALLDSEGVVSDVWIGQLPPKKETEVLRKLQANDTRPSSEWEITPTELGRRMEQDEALLLLDIRGRSEFQAGHMPRAKNIPFDELAVRAPNEFNLTDAIVLCGDDDVTLDQAYLILRDQGFANLLVLNRTPN